MRDFDDGRSLKALVIGGLLLLSYCMTVAFGPGLLLRGGVADVGRYEAMICEAALARAGVPCAETD